jgi:hypothetical protein
VMKKRSRRRNTHERRSLKTGHVSCETETLCFESRRW